MSKPLVSTFIVGAPKCGTSSVYELLKKYSDVGLTRVKETHFFSQQSVLQSYYKVKIIKDFKKYLDEFPKENNNNVDICPSYLTCEYAPLKIFKYNSKAKIIILIRNPAERAISHYLMDQKLGLNNQGFIESLSHQKFMKEYIYEGFYSKWIKRYQSIFGKDSVYVYDFDKIIIPGSKHLQDLYRLITDQNETNFLTLPKENSFSRSRGFYFSIARRTLSNWKLKYFFPASIKNWIKKNVFEIKSAKPNMTDEKIYLNKIYKNEVEELKLILPEMNLGWHEK